MALGYLPLVAAVSAALVQPAHRPTYVLASAVVGAALALAAAGAGHGPLARRGRWTRAAGAAVVLAVAGVYAATLSPTTAATDSVEFQIVAQTLRIAHAPGYPLYTMLGHVVSWLPVGDMAWRMNGFSALCGTVAAALAYTLGRRLGGGPLAGATAALGLAFTPQLWSQVVITEVYALNMVLVLGVLFCLAALPSAGRAAVGGRPPGERWRLGALLLCGLGFTHHVTIAFVYPVVALVVLWRDRRLLLRPRDVALSAAALAAGLAPLAYLPWRWRAVNGAALDVATFLRYITGSNYPGLFDLGRLESEPARWVLLSFQLRDAFGWTMLALAFVGVAALARRRSVWSVALTALMAVFAAFYLGYYAWDGWVVLLPALAAIALAAGVGAAAIARAPRRTGDGDPAPTARTTRSAAAFAAAAPAIVAAAVAVVMTNGLWRVGPRVDASRGWEGQVIADRALAAPIPTGARLVVDPAIGAGFLFDRHLRGVRPDLDVVYADWPAGRDALADPLGQDRAIVTYGIDVAAFEARGIHPQPVGPAWLLARAAASAPPAGFVAPDEGLETPDGAYRLAGWHVDGPPARPGTAITVQLAWRCLRPSAAAPSTAVRLLRRRADAAAGAPRVRAVASLSPAWKDGEAAGGASVHAAGDVITESIPWPLDRSLDAARYELQAAPRSLPLAAQFDDATSAWPRLGALDVRPITRDDLSRDPAFADVLPLRRTWEDGVELVGIAAPAAIWPGQAFTVEGFWTHTGTAPVRPSGVRLAGPWTGDEPNDPNALATLPAAPWPGGDRAIWVTRWAGRFPSAVPPGAGAKRPPPRLRRVRGGGDTSGTAMGRDVRIPALTIQAATPGLAGVTQFDDGVALVGFAPRRRVVAPGDWIAVRTDWTATRRPDGRDKAFVQLLDAAQAMRASSDREVLYGAEPTDDWRPGELHRDVYFVRVPADMPPGAAWLQVGLYDKTTRARRRVIGQDGVLGDDRFMTGVYIGDRDGGGAPRSLDRRAALAFDGGPTITAVRVPPRTAIRSGAPLTVTLRWRADGSIGRDWTVFVHLLAGAEGAAPLAQADGMPFGDVFPMRLWPRGAEFTSTHRLDVPAGAKPAGDWVVAIGLYDAASLERASIHGFVEGGMVDEANRRALVRPPDAAP